MILRIRKRLLSRCERLKIYCAAVFQKIFGLFLKRRRLLVCYHLVYGVDTMLTFYLRQLVYLKLVVNKKDVALGPNSFFTKDRFELKYYWAQNKINQKCKNPK